MTWVKTSSVDVEGNEALEGITITFTLRVAECASADYVTVKLTVQQSNPQRTKNVKPSANDKRKVHIRMFFYKLKLYAIWLLTFYTPQKLRS